jgi:rsbT co-antagonist protein RsbR
MNDSLHLLKNYVRDNRNDMVNKIIHAIDQNQLETYLRLSHQSYEIEYRDQIQQLIRLLADTTEGSSNYEGINEWGREVSEDSVRLGLTLSQSIQHFTIIRSVLWERLEDFSAIHAELKSHAILMLGQFINDFMDAIVLSFTISYNGLTNKRLRAQQEVIDELSTPVISIVDGVAVLPIIGDIDTHRAKFLMEHTLKETSRQNVDCLIIDLSGVFIVDTMVAQELFKIIGSLKLTGVDVTITGMRPELAQSVVTLGIRFEGMKLYNDLGQALKSFGIVRK